MVVGIPGILSFEGGRRIFKACFLVVVSLAGREFSSFVQHGEPMLECKRPTPPMPRHLGDKAPKRPFFRTMVVNNRLDSRGF